MYFSALKENCPDAELLEEDAIPAGDYTATRYRFRYDEQDGAVRGDFIMWWTGKRTYTCTLVSYEDDYEMNNEVVEDALGSFQVNSDL